jgi:hypothetical protein
VAGNVLRSNPIGDKTIDRGRRVLEAGNDADSVPFGLVLRHLGLAFDAGDH